MNYREESLKGATGVELVLALYDGAVRFLYRAMRAVEEDDVIERRYAVKRALDILMYLEARLRPDVGGAPAQSLAQFYAAMFQLTLEASHAASSEMFLQAIRCMRNVRDAWVEVARDTRANSVMPRELRTAAERMATPVAAMQESAVSLTRWTV